MVYNHDLAERILKILEAHAGIKETKMFGGVGYLVGGNMACGVNKDDLIIRVGPEKYEAALTEEHTKVFDLTGRPMTGWIVVTEAGYRTDSDLKTWVERGLDYASSLPHKIGNQI